MSNDKIKEIMEKLEKGISDVFESEKYKNYLKFLSSFHNYSANNSMLIFLQKPDASLVAGYKSWQKLGRQVQRGEKGIDILAPMPYKFTKDVEKIDPGTGKKTVETKEVQGLNFRKVSVFDVSQTQGKELPSLITEIKTSSKNAENVINSIKRISEIPISFEDIKDGSKGYYSPLENRIAIKEGMSLDQTVKTLVHEYTHSQLHSKGLTDIDRRTAEVQAESVAFIVSNKFGIDTSEYSFSYVAAWSSGKELEELKSSLDIIQKTSNQIIEKIENVLSREIELQNSPAKIEILWSESDKLQKGQIFDLEEANELFKKLDQDQAELMKNNPNVDFSKVAAGEQVDFIPFLKIKFELQLADGRTSEARFDFGQSEYKDLFDCIKRECYIDVQEYIKQHNINKIQETEANYNLDGMVKVDYETALKAFSDNKAVYLLHNDNSESLANNNKEIIEHFNNLGNGSLGLEKNEHTSFLKLQELPIKDKIIELYKSEFPAIKYISESTAKFINDTNHKQEQFVTIKELKQAYKHAGEWLDKDNSPGNKQIFDTLQNIVDDFKQAQLKEFQLKAQEKTINKELNNSKKMEMIL